MSRITRIRLFPLFFHNGCSQSSRFLPQARRIVGSRVENGDENARESRGAFCLRMLRRKYFDVSNRWYAPPLRGRKSQNSGGFNETISVVFPFVTCVKESENQPNGFVESRRKSQPSPFQKVKA